ncbi:hypothetical protein [Methylobacterium sp. J-076]|uniref:hypothetical protein n=1 Tax=Methylobacterium sp. J-076 TaxID=2836655 RepID=UPI001FB9F166|nr:hypothetical protein [Methylobacterium sp. J-076]MCJ2011805.1 hypothetical protein [Methylobacterium sp. J-076]
MSNRRPLNWNAALRDLNGDRLAVVPGLVTARNRVSAFAGFRKARPVQGREDGTIASRAAILVSNRLWALARETIAMPPPKTMDGLRATALASVILCEAEHSEDDPTTLAAIGVTRAALSVTGTPLPPGFVGFGDETDHEARDDALPEHPPMPNVVAFTPRPRPPEQAAPAPLAGLALRACLEEAAQTALDAADKIIAALDRIDGEDAETTIDPCPAMAAQVVRLGDLGSFATSIARPREEAPAEPEVPQDEARTEPAPAESASVATAEVRDLFPPLPWGGAGNVVAAAGCMVLALVGMRA